MAGMRGLGQEGWQYKHYSTDEERDSRCKEIIVDLLMGRLDSLGTVVDTRPVHFRMFSGMHPADMPYFAGNYRGSPHGLLANYNVMFDGINGVHFSAVAAHVSSLGEKAKKEVERLKQLGAVDDGKKLVAVVGVACTLMVKFMAIHPYADGNGHVGRYFIWSFLHHFNIHARRWPLNERPEPNYFDHIRCFREGQPKGLVTFVLKHVCNVEPANEAAF
ncbi:Fic family protein [Xanthomonas campestris]|uniref:Fic family protein n=1 Tax=Xanthomonas campestris TaxID=339 RepID=UPI0009BB87B0|nr:Fic family protein [Xanthomonas campestris]